MTEGGSGLVLGHHVAAHLDADVRQAPLGVGEAHDAAPGQGAEPLLGLEVPAVAGHEEGRRGPGLEPELATPSHVLYGQQRAVGDEHHVEGAVADDDVLGVVDDVGQGRARRRRRAVRPVLEDAVLAHLPVDVLRGVDGALDVGAVEVDGCAFGDVWGKLYVSDDPRGSRFAMGHMGHNLCDLQSKEVGTKENARKQSELELKNDTKGANKMLWKKVMHSTRRGEMVLTAQHIPEEGTRLSDLVDVEAGVDFESGLVDIIKDVYTLLILLDRRHR